MSGWMEGFIAGATCGTFFWLIVVFIVGWRLDKLELVEEAENE